MRQASAMTAKNAGVVLALTFALVACSAGSEAIIPENVFELQTLADAACRSVTKQDNGSWDDENPSRRWLSFDKRIKAFRFDRMSIAMDGPVSSEGICLGGGGDACRPERIIWLSRAFGACSQAEEQKRSVAFNDCLKTQTARGNASDELACQ
jgi:hypothetical protein